MEAEAAVLTGGATVVTPPSPWTGESQFSGDRNVHLPAGATARFTLPPATQRQVVFPVAEPLARTRASGAAVRALVLPGGFTVIRR